MPTSSPSVSSLPPRVQGTVAWWSDDKGYGFIHAHVDNAAAEPFDFFAHEQEFHGRDARAFLEGARVEFTPEPIGIAKSIVLLPA